MAREHEVVATPLLEKVIGNSNELEILHATESLRVKIGVLYYYGRPL